MKCPVCEKTYNDNLDKCPICGFEDYETLDALSAIRRDAEIREARNRYKERRDLEIQAARDREIELRKKEEAEKKAKFEKEKMLQRKKRNKAIVTTFIIIAICGFITIIIYLLSNSKPTPPVSTPASANSISTPTPSTPTPKTVMPSSETTEKNSIWTCINGHKNDSLDRFCGDCGAWMCSNGHGNGADAKFCGDCREEKPVSTSNQKPATPSSVTTATGNENAQRAEAAGTGSIWTCINGHKNENSDSYCGDCGAWMCSNGHGNGADAKFCGDCREEKPI